MQNPILSKRYNALCVNRKFNFLFKFLKILVFLKPFFSYY